MGEVKNFVIEVAKRIEEEYFESNRPLKDLIAKGKELIKNRREKYE